MTLAVHGIDWSGATDAGRRIFVASGVAERGAGGAVRIDACRRGDELSRSGRGRARAIAAVREFVAGAGASFVGCDFPFAIPRALTRARSWRSFALGFERRHPDPEAFRASCRARTGGAEPRRAADVAARAPFAPSNLRLYRQTWFGIAHFLAPLVRDGLARIVPMEPPEETLPNLVEACPASTLKAASLSVPYKGSAPAHEAHRERIVRFVEREAGVSFASRDLRARLVADAGGDALDSVHAALAAARAAADPRPLRAAHSIEGRIYF